MAWLDGWDRRKSHIVNQQAGAGANYQTLIKVYQGVGVDGNEVVDGILAGKVYCGGNCRNDFGDIRFTDDDETTLLDYWIQEYVDGDYAIIWVEVLDDLSVGNVTIYTYYDNPVATYPHGADQTEMDATFPFADHFYGDTLDAGKWNDSGAGIAVGGSEVTITNINWIRSINTYNQLTAFHAKSKTSATGSRNIHITDIGSNNYVNYYDLAPSFRYGLNKAGVPFAAAYAVDDIVYHKYEIRRIDGNLAIFYVDGGLIVSYVDPTHIPIIDLYFELSRWLNGTLIADYIFVRKVTNPEPVHGAWGAEEEEEELPTAPTDLQGCCICLD